jgi:transposase InsO family protein
MKRKGSEFFITSLYEIDRIIGDREIPEDEDTERLIRERLPERYRHLKDIFSKVESDKLPPHRPYDHKIHLEGPLPDSYSPLYRQSTEELQVTKQYLIDNLDKGFITASQSPFASPVLFVKKPTGGLRFCIDYRRLNELTRKDAYPIPRIDELLTRVSKAKIYTKLDIRAAFNRIRMDPESEEYTTFRTRYGTYKCKVLPFGLCNGPGTYQRYMNDVLLDYLDDFCMAYLDDILIYSENIKEHHRHVELVLKRLREAGLQADIKKCEFDVTRTKYLGYVITTTGIEPDPEKVEPLRNWKYPKTVTATKSYLGFCGFYRQFVRNFGLIAKPLTALTRPTVEWKWTEECRLAFETLRENLLRVQRIYHFDPELLTKLETDASDGVIAGVVSQQHADKAWYPIGFYSHVLNGHEPNWEIHDKELYAIVESFRKWRPELMSITTRLAVYSDHRSLEYFMTTKVLTAKQARWMEFLSDFNFQIIYTPGKDNQKADILSRREQDLELQEQVKLDSRSRVLLGPGRLDTRINAELAQQFIAGNATLAPILPGDDPNPPRNSFELLDKLRQDNRESFTELRCSLPEGYTIQDGLVLYQGRLCVRRNTLLCTRLIQEVHAQPSTAHPNGRKTYQLISPKYHWIGMSSDCNRYVRNCRACRYANQRQAKQQGMLHPLPVPEYPMQHLCMDYKDFPKDRHGFDRILVFIDRLGKDSVSIPCHQDIDARGTATLFVQWIYRFGHTPETIVSDRGPQFVSSFWDEFCRIIGVRIKLSTAYHKQTDGQTEIMNKYIDQRLRPFVNYYQDNWSDLLPLIDRAQVTLPHASIGMAPYRLKYGTDPRNSWDWEIPKAATPLEKLNREAARVVADRMKQAWETAKGNMEVAQDRMARNTNRHRRPIDWQVGDEVYLSTRNLKTYQPSRKLANQWEGPFKILEQVGHSYRLELPPGSQIHDVFAPDVLRKDPKDPLPGQESAKPPPQIIQGQEEWEVDKILAVRLYRKTLKYQVRWLGHDPDPTWYNASNLMGSPHKLRDFHQEYPERPGPPRNLPEWLQAWESGVEDYSHLKGNESI